MIHHTDIYLSDSVTRGMNIEDFPKSLRPFYLEHFQKGEFYTVSEMCVDGWFKGQSLRLGKSGVFPGNHVHQVDPGAKSVNFSPSLSIYCFCLQFVQGPFIIVKNVQSPLPMPAVSESISCFIKSYPLFVKCSVFFICTSRLIESIVRQRRQRRRERRVFRRWRWRISILSKLFECTFFWPLD